EPPGQRVGRAAGQGVEVVVFDQCQGQRQPVRVGVELVQLYGQAFGQVAGADAGRVEGLYGGHHRIDVVVCQAQTLLQVVADLTPTCQQAIVVDGVDDETGRLTLQRRERVHVGLPVEVGVQVGRCCQVGLLVIAPVLVVAAALGATMGCAVIGVNVAPVGIDREVVGNVAVGAATVGLLGAVRRFGADRK